METYSDQYERCKKAGITTPIVFLPVEKGPERFVELTEQHIPGISNGTYFVSNYGNIYNADSGSLVSQYSDKNGYMFASIYINGSLSRMGVHRLVLLAFDYRDDYKELQGNHIDGNHSNNTRANLEWTTPKENSDHAMLYGLHKMNGEDNGNNKLSEIQVREICELIQTGKYYDTEIAEMYNVSYVTISDIHKGKIWVKISREYQFGERKPRALYDSQIHEICKMLESGNYTDTEIAKKYNVAQQTILAIRQGKLHKNISCNYNITGKAKPKKFTKDQVREICEVLQTGKYYDTEIAEMYNTTPTFLRSLRIGQIHTDVTKDYDMTIRKNKI